MKFTLSWLKTHLDTSYTPAELAEHLTMLGLELEELSDPSHYLTPFTIAEILTTKRHPEADKLQLCQVNTGSETLEVVCGAPNARPGLKVIFAPIGTYIPGSQITLKKAKIRGVESNGMLCSAEELNLGGESDGIIELPADAPVGQHLIDYRPSWADPVFTLAVTPNRADCFGVRSIARDLAASGMGKLKPLTVEPVSGSLPAHRKISLQFPAGHEKACPYFVGRLIRGVKNGPSPAWLQERLQSIGSRSISALVDITNFLTVDRNRPLHVFDADKVKGDLTIRYAKQGEKLVALDDETYDLEPGMVVIADETEVLSLGGIMGGLSSGCTETTTNVFLEAAYFDPATISRTGRKLNIHSDARHRFERGVDPNSVLDGIEAATALILDLCGGEASDVVVAGSSPFTPQTIALRIDRIEQLVGVALAEDQATKILQDLGCIVTKAGETKTLNVTPPSWRVDLREEIDLVEECIRVHGYHTIPSLPLPKSPAITKSALTIEQKRVIALKRYLAQQGFLECVTWSFTDDKLAPYFIENKDQHQLITINNPIASQLSVMRPSLLPNLLLAARDNCHRGVRDFALFEVGPQFNAPDQQLSLAAGVRVGHGMPRHWAQQERDVDIYDIKADLWALITFLGLSPDRLTLRPEGPAWYHPGQVGSLYLGKNLVGRFGRLHPSYAKLFDIEEPVVLFECFYENLPLSKKKRQGWQPNPLQPVERDLAFIVAKSLPVADLVQSLQKVDKTLIQSIQVFDVYTGKGIDDDKKSIALNITIQPQTQTLTDAEIDALTQKMIQQASKDVQAVLRT